jgi:uncharacterized alpha/beta hydrolase family protein
MMRMMLELGLVLAVAIGLGVVIRTSAKENQPDKTLPEKDSHDEERDG